VTERMLRTSQVLIGNRKAIEDLANLQVFTGTGPFSGFFGGVAAAAEKIGAAETEAAATRAGKAYARWRQERDDLDTRLRQPLPVPGMDDFERGMNEAIIALGTSTAEQLRAELAELPVGSVEYQVKFAQLELEKGRISDTISTAISEGIADGSITTESELLTAFAELRSLLGPEGARVADALLDGLLERFKARTKSVANAFAQDFVRATNVAYGIRSPSTVFAKIGGHVVDGFTQGIDRGLVAASAAAARMRNVTASAAASTGSTPYIPAGRTTSINNNIYLPTGDPQAAALAVTNRQMALLWA